MTTFNITITNAVRTFGPQDTNRWGTMLWGQQWAYSAFDLPVYVTKEIDNTQVLADDWSTLLTINKTIANAQVLAGDMAMEELIDANGYKLLFGDQENAENRALTSYTISADQATAYTSVPRPTTSYNSQ